MRIVPAVDIRGGLCVNLVQGDYARETVFSEDPVPQALAWWRELGEGLVHIVDLDGAKAGRCCVASQLRAMAAAGVPFEVGGGIRNIETIRAIIEAGALRVILGTAAHRDPELLAAACAAFPGAIAVGIDARAGNVSLEGWTEDTTTDAVAFARTVEAAGAARIIYTDILSDGMMGGPNVEATAAVARAVSIPVTASGGVARLDDIRRLRAIETDGVDEVIIGRALYLGAFTIAEAKAAARGES
ncbi:MAG TPA: 1-(5-phosphoribosyl)-5-[(5-phosphoribosylamino)methylideneamino] imidazole-4-carboxamide isomerase [Candidatus Hydrogenedentes bacterium]|nr:1-(5-phosphoribosyl)-5-[(5-phosphoribosylamino)methylideneamino] imidazole-4-carboxamide isomerase [Candidatus Hydrogenedentota bacterium]HNT87013.1 1-(5-phosphoribosyl)-5-[(5-phosphoribosylamino)methylideneamino] imidazole-4-carboxamide isomerase [Candidatus Hydrogenedentota bacterium]